MTERNRLAVVTGASSGIGAATAARLALDGWRVVMVARRNDALDAVAARIPGETVVEALDASDGDAVLSMAERVFDRFGVPDALVNSAGAGQWKYIEDTPPVEAAQMMGAPFQAAYNVTHAFLGRMLARGSGAVVHVGSPASLLAWPGATAYTCSRWALRGLHEALRQDLAGAGVTTSHVLFGEVSSAYFENNPETYDHIPTIGKLIPVSTPERCARVIADTIARPRPQVLYPFALRAFFWAQYTTPGLARRLAVATGRRRTG